MNGRVYDPQLGRFLSADPTMQFPYSSQGYNRYSYVQNNPLKYTDPSGYGLFSKIFKSIKKLFKSVVKAITKYIRPIIQIVAAVYGGPLAAAITSAAIVKIDGGSWGDAFKAGIVSWATAQAYGKLHGMKYGFTKIVAHGVVGGLSSVASGGKFKHGFLSAAFTQAFSEVIDGISPGPGGKPARAIAAAVVGGTSSVLGGGKFANGAVTGAFSRLFNDESQRDPEMVGDPAPVTGPSVIGFTADVGFPFPIYSTSEGWRLLEVTFDTGLYIEKSIDGTSEFYTDYPWRPNLGDGFGTVGISYGMVVYSGSYDSLSKSDSAGAFITAGGKVIYNRNGSGNGMMVGVGLGGKFLRLPPVLRNKGFEAEVYVE